MMPGTLCRRIPRLALLVPLLALIALSASLGLLTPRQAVALDSEEQAFLTTINDYRAQNGLGPLALNDSLNNIARWMANDMGSNNYFSHTDSLGRDPFARMDQMGYGYNTWRGENLVAGTETSAYAFDMWRTSPGHNENMLGAHYTVIGIARVYYDDSTYGWYWATEFGGESGAPPPPAPTVAPAQPATAPPPPPPAAAPTNPPVTPSPAPTVAPTPAPTPSPTPAPTRAPTATPERAVTHHSQVAWWHALDSVSIDWNLAVLARNLASVAPSLERFFQELLHS
jgi:uncharacterized protein YkwD